MPRKTPDEIFTIIRLCEPDMDQMTKALRIVLDIGAKAKQAQEIPRNQENQKKAG